MNAAHRNQLRHLDHVLLGLVEDRARLLAEVARCDPGRAPAVEDLLRRHSGALSADAVRALFTAVDAACAPFGTPEDAG